MENLYDSAKWTDSNSPYYSSSVIVPAEHFVGKTESFSDSHRLAEKRRRDRINSHLSTLRKLIPNSDKLDKAALLARVIEQVKELKQKSTESSLFQQLPTESDSVTVHTEKDTNSIIYRASVCCEDQTEAISEIIKVPTNRQLEIVNAKIICVGGRMRINLILRDGNDKETVKALKQSLCGALNRITSVNSSVYKIRSKRQRWFLSCNYS